MVHKIGGRLLAEPTHLQNTASLRESQFQDRRFVSSGTVLIWNQGMILISVTKPARCEVLAVV